MISRGSAALLVFLDVIGLVVAGVDGPRPPATAKMTAEETVHGVKITDEYKWLENAADPAVQKWTEAQNQYTESVLATYPGLPAIRKRLKDLIDASSPSYRSLQFSGGKLFAMIGQPPREQPFLATYQSPDDPRLQQVILDPNKLSSRGSTAIDFYVPSLDGRLVAVCLSEGGSEDGTVSIYEVAGGKRLPDQIPRVNFPTAGGSVAWCAGNSGFYYTRYPHDGERDKGDLNFYQQIYFHKLGTPAAEDAYALGKEFPRIAESVLESSDDGRYILDTVQKGDGGEFEHYLLDPAGHWIQLSHFDDMVTAATFGPDDALYLLSLKDAPRGKILRLPLAAPELSKAKVIVPQSEVAINGFRLGAVGLSPTFVPTGERLYVLDSVGGPSQIRVFSHEGEAQGTVPILPVSSVGEILNAGKDGILFQNQSYLQPSAWYRFDPQTAKTTRTALFETSPAHYDDAEVVRDFAVSKDGTRVPINIIMRKGTQKNGTNPTLLTGYGGFGISQTPGFSGSRRIWLDQGGIFVIANLRGGGEYGEAWHKAGNLTNKQNVFDDFLACARYLIDHKYTSPARLAIRGGSNGGLLMGAALIQEPQLFRAVVAQVGIYDMLLHDRHPNGAFNVTEYGSATDSEQFKAIFAYSPYHHVRDGSPYPAVFFTTGANDGRVDPANSRKMAACLQAASTSGLPVLLKISSGAGHGMGTALSKQIEQEAEIYAFFFQQLGVEYRPGG